MGAVARWKRWAALVPAAAAIASGPGCAIGSGPELVTLAEECTPLVELRSEGEACLRIVRRNERWTVATVEVRGTEAERSSVIEVRIEPEHGPAVVERSLFNIDVAPGSQSTDRVEVCDEAVSASALISVPGREQPRSVSVGPVDVGHCSLPRSARRVLGPEPGAGGGVL